MRRPVNDNAVSQPLEGGRGVCRNDCETGRFNEEGLRLTEESGGQPPDPRSLSLSGQRKGAKKEKRKRKASAPSPVAPKALGSVSTVALSSLRVDI